MINKTILYQYLSEQYRTHVRIFDKCSLFQRLYTVQKNLPDHFAESPAYSAVLFPAVSEPQVTCVNHLLSYINIPLEDSMCVIGPFGICADSISQHQFPALLIPDELVDSVRIVGSNELIRLGVFLYNLFSDQPIDTFSCFQRNCPKGDFYANSMKEVARSVFYSEENNRRHNPYDAEVREMAGIENGNLEQLMESWKENHSGDLGTLSDDHLRWAKYLCVINTALSARAAIRGGLPYDLAYSLSDAYIQQIDALTESSIPLLEGIVRNIQVTYTKMVAQRKGDPVDHVPDSPLITRAKDYIFSHLHQRITVEDVADALHTHPNYLGRVFKKSEHLTVHDYILREKINLTRNMLTYSEYSYIDIANYLGFSSQSHLGSVFKKFTGMTMVLAYK